jgi:hydrogenase maturation protease
MKRSSDSVSEARILVLGIGNILLKDEGVGVRAIEELRHSHVLSPNVEVVDGGTAGLDLLEVMEGASDIIVVDCVAGDEEPGTVFRIPLDQLGCPEATFQSLHQVGILDTLRTLEMLGRRPRCVLIGVQPEEIALGLDLSPRVAAKLPQVVQAVLQELHRLGLEPPAS